VRWSADDDFCVIFRSVFSASRVQHISDLHSKFALGHTTCRSVVDIYSATTEIRRGKKKKEEERRKIEATGVKHNGLPITMGGHNKTFSIVILLF